MRLIYNIICLPSLLIHELLHIVVAFITLAKWKGIKIEKGNDFKHTFNFTFTVFTISRYRIQNTLIHLAPFLAILLPLILILFGNIWLGIGIGLYQVLTYCVIKPSSADYFAIKNFKTNKQLIDELYK